MKLGGMFVNLCLCVFLDTGKSTIIESKYPYGPVLCEQLCLRTIGCTSLVVYLRNLSCEINSGNKTKPFCASITGSYGIDLTATCVTIFIKQGEPIATEECPLNSRIVTGRNKFHHCVMRGEMLPRLKTTTSVTEVDYTTTGAYKQQELPTTRLAVKSTPKPLYDKNGHEVIPGDVLRVEIGWHSVGAVYIGNKEVVWRKKGGQVVLGSEVDIKDSVKFKATSGRCKVFTQADRISRAKGLVGRRIKIKGFYWLDFPTWVYTGMPFKQANLKGFDLRK